MKTTRDFLAHMLDDDGDCPSGCDVFEGASDPTPPRELQARHFAEVFAVAHPVVSYVPDAHALRKAVEAVHNETYGAHGDLAHIAVNAYTHALHIAQPEVNSDTELHVGTLIEDHKGRLLWHAWRTGGPGVLWLDDEGRPATPVFPARILSRPEVKP